LEGLKKLNSFLESEVERLKKLLTKKDDKADK
jgi:hypothetical protein